MGILPANILHGAQEQPADVDNEQPLLVVRVTDVNRQSHMDNIVRESRYNIRTALLTLNLLCQKNPMLKLMTKSQTRKTSSSRSSSWKFRGYCCTLLMNIVRYWMIRVPRFDTVVLVSTMRRCIYAVKLSTTWAYERLGCGISGCNMGFITQNLTIGQYAEDTH